MHLRLKLFASLILLGVALLLAALGVYRYGFNPDNAWQYTVAERILEGESYCCDAIVELNPPLSSYMTLIAVGITQAAGFKPITSHFLLTLLFIFVSFLLSFLVVGRKRVCRGEYLLFLMLSFALILMLPGSQFGQRDHWLIVLVLPYLVSFSRDRTNVSFSDSRALIVGIVAGLGFCLKPQTLPVVFLLELWFVTVTGRKQSIFNPYLVGVSSVVSIYAVVLLLFFGSYLNIVPDIYNFYSYVRWPEGYNYLLFLNVGLLVLLAGILLLRRCYVYPCFLNLQALFLAGAAFGVIAFFQNKGWPYYYLPALICLGAVLMVCVALTSCNALRRGLVVSVLVIIAGGFFWRYHPLYDTQRHIVTYLLGSDFKRVLVLDGDIALASPAIIESGRDNASRYPFLWWQNAVFFDVKHQGSAKTSTQVVSWDWSVIDDIRIKSPDVILVREHGPYLGYFGRYPEFLSVFRRYCTKDRVSDSISAYLRCDSTGSADG